MLWQLPNNWKGHQEIIDYQGVETCFFHVYNDKKFLIIVANRQIEWLCVLSTRLSAHWAKWSASTRAIDSADKKQRKPNTVKPFPKWNTITSLEYARAKPLWYMSQCDKPPTQCRLRVHASENNEWMFLVATDRDGTFAPIYVPLQNSPFLLGL